MAYNPNNANGQATMANSAPVVIASNQSSIPVTSAGIPTALGQTSAANSQPVTLSNENILDQLISGFASGTAVINTNILNTGANTTTSTDCQQYRSIAFQVITAASTTAVAVNFEGSNDNTTFYAVPLFDSAAPATAAATTFTTAASANRYFEGPIKYRYFRARANVAISAGGVHCETILRMAPFKPTTEHVVVDSGTVTTVSTVTAVTTLTTLANGQTAHSSASTGSPVRVGGRVITTQDLTLVQGDASDLAVTTGQQLVTKDFGSAENDWTFASATSGIVNTTTAVTVKTAGGASLRNYITGISIMAEALGTATEFAIRDGAAGTVLWRIKIGTAGLPLTQIIFPNPLRGTAATLVEIVTLTASTTGAVYANLTGYTGF